MSANDQQTGPCPVPRLINEAQRPQRPSTRHGSRSQAQNLGSMQDQLRAAAQARAQRSNKDMVEIADNESLEGRAVPTENTNDASNESDEIDELSAAGPPEDIHPWVDEEAGFDAQDNVDIHDIQQVGDMRRDRQQRALQAIGDETWYQCFSEPTPEWKQRRCNLYMHATASLIVLFVDTPGCQIPLTTWLSVYFFLLCIETMTMEYRGRMHNSPYYQHYRLRRKIIQNGMVVVKEVCEALWVIYGITLYYSDKEQGCADENRGFIIIMAMFLLLGVLKLVLFVIVLGIMIYITVQSKLRKRSQRNASVQVLRSIQKIRFRSLADQNDLATDEECIICYMEYSEDDIVSKLKCDEKHIFHTSCIEEWIRQGKNSCPVCRAPINSSIQL